MRPVGHILGECISVDPRGTSAPWANPYRYRLWALAGIVAALQLNVALGAVTDFGSYQTTIDVEVPEFHRITPEIRLSYNSSAGSGPLGYGWSLQVGSQISRTSALLGTPKFQATDRLWLDGAELLPCADASQSVSCSTGGTHTTRVESYSRITLDPTSNSWTLWRRDGMRYLYGPRYRDVTSPIDTLRWILTAVVDTHGNQVTYEYACGPSFTCYISDISYGGGSSCKPSEPERPDEPIVPAGSRLPGVNIHFFWEGRSDPLTVAIGGQIQEMRSRLRAIDVQEGGERVRVYQITYVPELSGLLGYKHRRSWLQSIQAFGSDAVVDIGGNVTSGTAAPANRFEIPAVQNAPAPSFMNTYAGNADFGPAGPTTVTFPQIYPSRFVQGLPPSRVVIATYRSDLPGALDVGNTRSATTGDFDGDRRLDFLNWGIDGACTLFQTRTLLASTSASTPIDQPHPLPASNRCMTGVYVTDLDGDARSDLLLVRYARVAPYDARNIAYQAELIPALSNGDGTFATVDGTFATVATTVLWTSANEAEILLSRCTTGDFNGDGRGDFACTLKQSGSWVVRQATSTGAGRFRPTTDSQQNPLTDAHTLSSADANGDGLSDLVAMDQRTSSSVLLLQFNVGVSLGGGFLWRTQPTWIPAAATGDRSRLLSGDFNGDGRADFAFVVADQRGSGGSITTFASAAGANHLYRVVRSSVTGEMPSVSVGDANGDRRDDLVYAVRQRAGTCGATSSFDTQALAYSFSDGTGSFNVPQRFDTCYEETGNPWVGNWTHDAHAAQVNGDQIADIFQYFVAQSLVGNVLSFGFSIVDRPGPYIAADVWKWRPTDINGDGRSDWLYVNYANPGLIVASVIAQADGTRRRFVQTIASDAVSPPDLARVDLARVDLLSKLILADVGGPGGAPDGRVDIVVLDDATRQIVTLLSNGDGTWQKRRANYGFAPTSILRGHILSSAPEAWRALDTTGDGRTDLVHLGFIDAGAATAATLRVTLLRSVGDGTWSLPVFNDYGFRGNPFGPNVRAFQPADINGDGRMDLVAIEFSSFLPLGQNATVRTLISRGDGNWEEDVTGVALPTEATASWAPMEVNGDGRADLASIILRPGQPLVVSSLLSLGNGRWQAGNNLAPTPSGSTDTEARSDLRVVDLDGDGRQDVVGISKTAALQADTTIYWNRYPNSVRTRSGLAVGTDDNTSWVVVDFDSDARAELAQVQLSASTELDVITLPVHETRITRARNGMGASDEIAYGTSPEAQRSMPLGALPRIVKSVGARSEEGAAYAASTTYTFANATYSFGERRFLGYASVEQKDGVRTVRAELKLAPVCSARRSMEEISSVDGRLIERTRFVFTAPRPPGSTSRYVICRVENVMREEWEGAATPRISKAQMTYDGFGNVIDLLQTGDVADTDDDRRIERQVNPNDREFIVDRIALEAVHERAGSGWRQLARTLYEYDGSGDYRVEPGRPGELTRVRRESQSPKQFLDTSYGYDSVGNVVLTTGPPIPSNTNGVMTSVEYDCDFARFPLRVCNDLHCTTVGWNRRHGKVGSLTDPNGSITSFGYDALGRTILETHPDQSFDRWKWPAANQWGTPAQMVTREVSDGSRVDGVFWEKAYFDGLGRATRVEREGGVAQENLAFDGPSSRVLRKSAPHFLQDPPSITTHRYDAAGRVTMTEHPDGSSARVTYGLGTQTLQDELGARTEYEIDVFGRITAVREHRRDCFTENCPVVETAVTRYRYDALNRLLEITDAKKHTTTWDWDEFGRRRSVCGPDRGCTRYRWNDDGNLALDQDANGNSRRIDYDAIGRPSQRRSFDSSQRMTREVRWTWDTVLGTAAPNGASIGHVTKVEDVSSATSLRSSYHYDVMGRIDLDRKCIDNQCYELATRFDASGRIENVTYPGSNGIVDSSSQSVDYVYGVDGTLESIPGYVQRILRGPTGQAREITFENGVTESRVRDRARGWIDRIEVQGAGGATLFEQDVLHNNAGRIREQRVRYSQGARRDVFGRDDRGRLVSVTSTDARHDRVYGYDLVGNLMRHSLLGDVYYADPDHVHAPTGTQRGDLYRYDAVGQLRRSNALRIDWNEDYRPSLVRTATGSIAYAYDDEGILVKTQSIGAVVLRPHPNVEVDANGRIITSIFADGRRLVRLERPGNPSLLHSDALGSTRIVTDRLGAVIDEHDYEASGTETRSFQQTTNRFRFAGAQTDTQAGLVYMQSRYYDPVLMRFISPDTLIPDVYAPETLNRYAYALNDPVTLTDPSGFCVPEPSGEYGLDCTDRRTPAQPDFSSQREIYIDSPNQHNPNLDRVPHKFHHDPIAGTQGGPQVQFRPSEPNPQNQAAQDWAFAQGMARLDHLLGKLNQAEIGALRAQAANNPAIPQLRPADSPFLATNDTFLKQLERNGTYDVLLDPLITALGAKAVQIGIRLLEGRSVIYGRLNPLTGELYVGQSRTSATFLERQWAHDTKLGVQHEFFELERVWPGRRGIAVDVAEETWIRRGGGPLNQGGGLANKRYQKADDAYRLFGGKEFKPRP